MGNPLETVIKARGEAESINLRGKALRENPSILELQIVERWDGITPLVVGPGAAGANMVLPLGNMKTGDQAMEGKSAEVVRRQPDGTWLFAIDDPYGRSMEARA